MGNLYPLQLSPEKGKHGFLFCPVSSQTANLESTASAVEQAGEWEALSELFFLKHFKISFSSIQVFTVGKNETFLLQKNIKKKKSPFNISIQNHHY